MKNDKPLKIGFVFDDSLDSHDGVAQYVKNLGRWYSAQGHQVSYLVGETKLPSWASGKIYSLSKNLKVKFNGNRVSIPLPGNSKVIKEVLSHNFFDVLHVQAPYSPFMAGKIVKNAHKSTLVVGTFHVAPASWFVALSTRLLAIYSRRSLKRFDKFFSVSQAARDFGLKSYHIDSEISPNVVDIASFKTIRTKTPNYPARIVYLGRLVERKGVADLLKAFNIVHQKHQDVNLVIAGKGPLENELKKFVLQKKLGSRVEFLGFIEEKDKPSLLAGADIACFPSISGESFGIVLIEAMAAGSGVVLAGNNPGYSTVLSTLPQTLFDPKNEVEFSAKLEQFLKDEKLQERTHKAQQEMVKQYDVKLVGAKMLNSYHKEIAMKRKRSNN